MNLKLTLYLVSIIIIFTNCTQNSNLESVREQSDPEGIVLKNNTVQAVFSKENGALLRLVYKKTNWKIQTRTELSLSFNMLVPLKERRNNQILGIKQKLAFVVVSYDGKTATFKWDHLLSEYGGVMDIILTGVVAIDTTGLTFNKDVVNNSQNVIEAISYPSLGYVAQLLKDEKLENLRSGYASMETSSLLPNFENYCGYWGVDWPTQMVKSFDSPFILVATSKQGLYSGYHDNTSKELGKWTFELIPGYGTSNNEIATPEEASKYTPHMEMKVWHFPFANPGEKISLSPIVLNSYSGDWHYGVDNYNTWRKTWFQQPQTPDWALNVHSWLQLHFNSPEEEWRIQFKDLPKYAEECAKNGVSVIQLFGWNNGGQYRGNSSHDFDPHMGIKLELKDAIAACEKLGVRIILFNKYTWADQMTPEYGKNIDVLRNKYKDYGWDGKFRDVLGTSVTENGQNYSSYSGFHHAKENKHAVFVVNNDAQNEKIVEVKIVGSYQALEYITPEDLTPRSFTGKVIIPAMSAVVVLGKI